MGTSRDPMRGSAALTGATRDSHVVGGVAQEKAA